MYAREIYIKDVSCIPISIVDPLTLIAEQPLLSSPLLVVLEDFGI